jgi:hypothetical protein
MSVKKHFRAYQVTREDNCLLTIWSTRQLMHVNVSLLWRLRAILETESFCDCDLLFSYREPAFALSVDNQTHLLEIG